MSKYTTFILVGNTKTNICMSYSTLFKTIYLSDQLKIL